MILCRIHARTTARRKGPSPWLLLAVVLTGFVIMAKPARAGDGEWILSVSPEAAMARAWGKTHWGPGMELAVEYGLSDSWTLRGQATYAALWAPGSQPNSMLSMVQGGADVVWNLDVLRLIPFIHAGLAAAALGGRDQKWTPFLAIRIGAGLDYLLNRCWTVGMTVTYNLLVPKVTQVPALLGLGFRATYRWF
ncbi:MAG: hypothetical protein J7M25_16670 [Deltaproteobacteria bacterium]|nr:hypothetical protein [Deltaproteobacteria bacterium]